MSPEYFRIRSLPCCPSLEPYNLLALKRKGGRPDSELGRPPLSFRPRLTYGAGQPLLLNSSSLFLTLLINFLRFFWGGVVVSGP